ncbi:MAG: redox-sensing transcriptional repressor Rex [Dehalococcoidia bacterium]|nr:redox-sensing transcriptional repressor Rex [Dehalococcoidia bacterium]
MEADNAALEIPEVVIRRLPIYARALAFLEEENLAVVSSLDLGRRLGVTPAQIRKDLSHFGEFGKQGTGYNVRSLLNEIRSILGLDRDWPMVLIGVGKLGRAIATYEDFDNQGFKLVAAFDVDPHKVGEYIGGLRIQPIDELAQTIAEKNVRIAIVAVPGSHGQKTIELLAACGITAVLNYAPIAVRVPNGVRVRHIDPVVALQSLTYYLKSSGEAKQEKGQLLKPDDGAGPPAAI